MTAVSAVVHFSSLVIFVCLYSAGILCHIIIKICTRCHRSRQQQYVVNLKLFCWP